MGSSESLNEYKWREVPTLYLSKILLHSLIHSFGGNKFASLHLITGQDSASDCVCGLSSIQFLAAFVKCEFLFQKACELTDTRGERTLPIILGFMGVLD